VPDPPWRCSNEADATPTWLESLPGWLRDSLAAVPGWPEADAATLDLMLSEVATNVVEHGTTDGPARVRLDLVVDTSRVTVVLADDGPPAHVDVAGAQMPGTEAEGGRGLALVAALAEDFRWEQTPTGNLWSFTYARSSQA
jgi:serine/threonine-protein kinase RsbW